MRDGGMDEAARLRAQAAKCRQLARSINDARAVQSLSDLAAESDATAERLDSARRS